MPLIVPSRSLASVNPASPINWRDGLNAGLVFSWVGLPAWAGGTVARDLTRRHDGTLTSMDPATDWVAGDRGYELAFSNGQYVDCGDHADFDAGYYTVVVVAKSSAAPSAAISSVLAMNASGEHGVLSWGHSNADFRQSWACLDAGGTYRAAKYTTALQADTMYHLAMTYNASKMRIFLDGSFEAENLSGTGARSASGSMLIGGQNNLSRCFTGNIAGAWIWNRMLSDAEIAKHYQEYLTGYSRLLNRMRLFVPGVVGDPFAIDPETGEIMVLNASRLSAGQTWKLGVRVTDAAMDTDDALITIDVTA